MKRNISKENKTMKQHDIKVIRHFQPVSRSNLSEYLPSLPLRSNIDAGKSVVDRRKQTENRQNSQCNELDKLEVRWSHFGILNEVMHCFIVLCLGGMIEICKVCVITHQNAVKNRIGNLEKQLTVLRCDLDKLEEKDSEQQNANVAVTGIKAIENADRLKVKQELSRASHQHKMKSQVTFHLELRFVCSNGIYIRERK